MSTGSTDVAAHKFCKPACRAAHHRLAKRLRDPYSQEAIDAMVKAEFQRQLAAWPQWQLEVLDALEVEEGDR